MNTDTERAQVEEAELERQRVAEVFGLTGGELSDEPWELPIMHETYHVTYWYGGRTMSEASQYAAKALAYARTKGAEDGKAAATWVTDGNTTEATARHLLKGLAEGDPEVMDQLPAPDLSGEWADRITAQDLLEESLAYVGLAFTDISDGLPDELCDAYELAFSETVQDEVARACKYILSQ